MIRSALPTLLRVEHAAERRQSAFVAAPVAIPNFNYRCFVPGDIATLDTPGWSSPFHGELVNQPLSVVPILTAVALLVWLMRVARRRRRDAGRRIPAISSASSTGSCTSGRWP